MRIVSWNANCRFRDKINLFSPESVDVLVVQECENTKTSANSYQNAGWDFIWTGENKHKGLGIFVPTSTPIYSLEWDIQDCQYFLPAKIRDNIAIVGVWAMGGKSKSKSYAGQITRFLDYHGDKIQAEVPLMIGDFNSNAIWDKRHSRANHSNNDTQLKEFGLRSLYHVQKSTEQGQEDEYTFYMYRKREKPYHLDYAYLPEKIVRECSLKIGCPDKWLEHSDHMPLFVEAAIHTI